MDGHILVYVYTFSRGQSFTVSTAELKTITRSHMDI
jgi:hypothetical protein